MKSIILIAVALVAVAVAAPPEPVKTIRSEFNIDPEGSYVYGFETENGIVRSESGDVKEALDEESKPHKVVVMRGSYSFVDDKGVPHSVTYVADENGFVAQSDDIPIAPAPGRR